MLQDPLQIALEQHRTGKLTKAEAAYRAILAAEPGHLEANHWLGVLLTQANLAGEALPYLQRAAEGKPEDAAAWHNLGQAALSAGQTEQAVSAFERSASLEPDRPEVAGSLAQAYLVRRQPGDADKAAATLRRIIAGDKAAPELHYNLGLALMAARKPAEAVEAFNAAVAGREQYIPAMFQLAQAYSATRQTRDARRYLNKILEIEPDHARAWHALASLDSDAGNLPIAAALFRKAIKAKPDFVGAYQGLGFTLSRMGKKAESEKAFADGILAAKGKLTPAEASLRAKPAGIEAMEKRLTPDEVGQQLHQALAGLMNLMPPSQIAAEEVANLFDRYAYRFDAHLRETLKYQAPELVVEALKPFLPPTQVEIVDLGCGTGLCGPLLKPFAQNLIGVDLSGAMLEKAVLLGLYDRLDKADLVDAMKQMADGVDVLVAADVLLYFGDLAPVFEAAALALRVGGLFGFTVEAGEVDRYSLNSKTRRYTHSAGYLHHLAKIYGFEVKAFTSAVLRINAHLPVNGYVMVLGK